MKPSNDRPRMGANIVCVGLGPAFGLRSQFATLKRGQNIVSLHRLIVSEGRISLFWDPNLNRNLNLQTQSARGLAHSKTLCDIRGSAVNAKRPGVRRPSAACNLLSAIRIKITSHSNLQ